MPSRTKRATSATPASNTPQSRVPTYRRLKRANGKHLAFVDLDGRRVYLGEWDSPQSKQAYQRVLVERSRGIVSTHDSDDLFIAELLAAFADHARVYYREPDGAPGREVANFAPLVRLIQDLYGDRPASAFDARALKNVRQAMIDKGYARRTINRMVVRARSIFKWGVSEGLVPPTVLTSLSAVDGLRAGRTAAKETPPVMPVTESQIEATLPFMPQVLQDMVRVQLYTGMRPGELSGRSPWTVRHNTFFKAIGTMPATPGQDPEGRSAAGAVVSGRRWWPRSAVRLLDRWRVQNEPPPPIGAAARA